MRFTLSKDGKTFETPFIIPTPKKWSAVEKHLEEASEHFKDIAHAYGCIAGVLNRERSELVRSPNLPEWIGKPLRKTFSSVFDAPVSFYNDAVLGGMGEAIYGAGQESAILGYLTVGTGVGGARIVNGLADSGVHNFEPGHQLFLPSDAVTLESLISGAYFIKRYGKDFTKSAPAYAWEQAANVLAAGIHNAIVYWSPDTIVLGGSMVLKDPAIPFDIVLKRLKQLLTIYPDLPEIKKAKLGDSSGLYGALSLCAGE